jgi:cysteine desulfurase
MFWKKTPKRAYLDYSAATPLLPKAKAAMEPFLTSNFANPSAIHSEGREARVAIEAAREKTAKAFQVRPEFVTFTSGGTEANNLAIIGTIEKLRNKGRSFADMEIVTTRIEHPSVMNAMKALEANGGVVKYVPVDENGLVRLTVLQEMLSAKTVLFSVAYANSEVGVVQKVHAIKKALDAAEQRFGNKIYFHLDAAQAPLWLNCQLDSLKVDLLTLDAGKCNGPKGVGVLLRSRRAEVAPYMLGGRQEGGLRAGTENVAGIVGAAVAFQCAQENYKERTVSVAAKRDLAVEYILTELPEAILNGPVGEQRLANNINISIPNVDTEFATVVLDKHGFAVSTKSACAGAGGGGSAVVKEISGDPARAGSTLRISLAPDSTEEDLKRLTTVLKHHLTQIKKIDNIA